MADIPLPPTLGLVLAGGLARRMGGGDKARIEIGGVSILDRVLATSVGAMRRHHHQRQWRPRALRRYRRGPSCPTTCRTIPARSPASSPGSTGWRRRTTASNGCSACRATARSCPTTWWNACTSARRKMGAGVPLACARSGEWRHPVVGLWPLALRAEPAQGAGRGRPAQDRGLDGAAWRRGRRLAGRAGRPVPQRQHARGRRARDAHCAAAFRHLNS